MASRFQHRDARSSLFSSYDAQNQPRSSSRPSSAAPTPYSYNTNNNTSSTFDNSAPPAGAFGAYPSKSTYSNAGSAGLYGNAAPGAGFAGRGYGDAGPAGGFVGERSRSAGGFRTATPDRKTGGYSDAVLSELESQNDEQVSEMGKKVAMLKDVRITPLPFPKKKKRGSSGMFLYVWLLTLFDCGR